MTFDFPNSEALLEEVQDQGLYAKLIVQLQKDFVRANVPVALMGREGDEPLPPKVLRTLLHEKIYLLFMERLKEYLNLLYIIDVPERAIKEIPPTDSVEVAAQVSLLILKREFQKIWFRENPSGRIYLGN
ncbi:MAG: hypothetical protein AAGA86_04215 [Bacteroidota bacterium]